MGQISNHEAHQLWSAIIDHQQASIAVVEARSKADSTGATEDDMKQMQAQNELHERRDNLRALIGSHIKEEN